MFPDIMMLNTLGISEIVDTIGEFFTSIPATIGSAIVNALTTLLGKALYYLVIKGMLGLVNVVYRIFGVFAGLSRVEYDGDYDYLLDVFFSNSLITKLYWGMAVIGLAMVFGFAILSVIRKIFDMDDKHQRPLGSILKNCFKSIFVILVLNLCVTGVINFSNTLMQSVTYLFNNVENIGKLTTITYTPQQYSSMARVLNTIGNYSLNPSYDSRYNINSCFNAIRMDLLDLQQQGVFSGYYETQDEDGNEIINWMTVLQAIVECQDLSKDVKMDIYYDGVTQAITSAMDTIKNNPRLSALQSYTFPVYSVDATEMTIDRILFLMGTSHAARDSSYNDSAEMTDALRGPFYNGDKNMYDLEQVSAAFNIKVGSIDYLLIAVCAFFVLKYLIRAIFQCSSRVFMLMGLYIVAPPFVSVMPFDDGEKFKQWTQAFIIQVFGIFGTVIPIRLLLTFTPIIVSSKLDMFPGSSFLNLVCKVLLIVGCLVAIDSFSQVFNGMLSGNAAMSSAMATGKAGSVGDMAFGAGAKLAGGAAKVGLGVAGKVAGGALGAVGAVTGLSTLKNKVGNALGGAMDKVSGAFQHMRENGGIIGSLANLPRSNKNLGNKDNGPKK